MSETENTKAVILTQADGQKIFLDLNMSTDTTAIKSFEKGAELSIASFDYATGIAVFLALCATGLAYWYGQRSFRLTEMSFRIVSEDINNSAETNRKTTEEIIKSQQKIKYLEINYQREKDWLEKVMNQYLLTDPLFRDYFLNLDTVNLLMKEAYENNNTSLAEENYFQELDIIYKQGEKLIQNFDKLEFLLELYGFENRTLIIDINEIKKIISSTIEDFTRKNFLSENMNILNIKYLAFQTDLKTQLTLIFNKNKAS